MFDRLGGFAIKHKIWIILAWVAVALLLFFLAPSLSQVGTMTEANFLPGDSESLSCRELIARYFPQSQATSSASLVFYNPQKLSEGDLVYARQVQHWLTSGTTPFKVANVTSVFSHPEMESRLKSPDGTTMLLNVGLEKAAFESDSLTTTQAIRSFLKQPPAGLEIYVSGQVGVYSDLFESLNKSITLTTLITVILVVVLLIIIFRSPIAALVPLFTIGIAYLAARGIIGIIAGAGVSIWSQIDVFLIVMIFGIGTDYCLFLVSRFREELVHNENRSGALRFAVSKIGVVITASAFAVIVGLAGMAVARYQMIQTMGPILGVAILITLLAALTLAPALTALFGRKLFWPLHNHQPKAVQAGRKGLWERIAAISTGKPAIVAGVVIVIMLLPYFALPRMSSSFDQLGEIPAGSESVKGFKVLQQHYDIGEMDPMNTILVAPEGMKMTDPAALAALAKIGSDLQKLNGIVKVQSIVQPDGSGQTPAGLTVAGQLASISAGISSSFSATQADPSVLFSDQTGAAFLRINGYLAELEQNFPSVNEDKNYQALLDDMAGLQQTIEQTRSAAPVENLDTLKTQFSAFLADLNNLSAAFSRNGNPIFLSPNLLQGPEAANLQGTFLSQDLRATRIYIVLGYYPQSDPALNVVGETRKAIQASIQGTALSQAEIVTGGTTAEMADVRKVLDEDFIRVMIVVLAAIFIVLVLLLRSLIAPIYLLLTVLLSYGTTLGVSSWIFQDLLGQAGTSFIIPIMVFVLLIALGSDYNIFLMSRVKEEAQIHPTREGARLAAIATGGVITACGIILAGTFGALVITPIKTMLQIGASVAIGILIDTFIVRALLVPAIASLLGRWNWWPGKHG